MWTRRGVLRGAGVGALVLAVPELTGGCGSSAGGEQLVSVDVSRDAPVPGLIGSGAGVVGALGGGLYGWLAGAGGNLALSPYSVAVALGMAVNGAAGRTRDEMLQVLRAAGVAELDSGLNALTQYVESLAGPVPHVQHAVVDLAPANQLFGQQGEHWQPAFLETLARSYGAGLRQVDYEHDRDGARDEINAWTAGHTHGRIPEIVPPGALDALTRLALVNSLYFKASWLTPFERDLTSNDDFHLADGTLVRVPTMHGSGSGYGAGDGWRSARVPYAGGLAMTLVLPDEGRSADVDGLVASGGVGDLLLATEGDVDVALPRWTFRTGASLGAPLAALGMSTAFTDAADFSGVTTDETLHLGGVLHQVFVAVDEVGTEAAAATAGVFEARSGQLHPPDPVVLDRPFLFVVHDLAHGTPLFLGRVADPRG